MLLSKKKNLTVLQRNDKQAMQKLFHKANAANALQMLVDDSFVWKQAKLFKWFK